MFFFCSAIDETKNYLYNELWKICAGPLFDLPKYGENIYYFPQGHIEHLEAYTKDDLGQIRPIFDIPSKIRCNVTDIQLKVENNTDNIYAKITLLPNIAEGEMLIPNGNQENHNFVYFTKVLSASDVSMHGGFTIFKRHAVECLPLLDMSQPTPTQEIVAKDLHGYEWRFKHIFRGTPQRHIFTTGWSAFVTAKKLVAGDSFVFLRGENGESLVGTIRAARKQSNILSSVISKQCMHNRIIASALNATNTKCMFDVFCKPRSSQFVVNFNKVIDGMNNKFNIDSKIMMRFEGKDFAEIRCSGTIVKIHDFSSYWRNSEWRNLEVKWDKPASIPRPDKVSPWEIELLAPTSNVTHSALLKNKRSRPIDEIGVSMWIPTLTQSQEIGQSSVNSPENISKLSYRDATGYSKNSSDWLMSNSIPTISKSNENNQMLMSINKKTTTDTTCSYKLFGVDLVQMQGVAIGRAVDLTILDGYNHLIDELDKLFDLKGELHTRNQWEIVFKDDKGDKMLVGDDPWPYRVLQHSEENSNMFKRNGQDHKIKEQNL
ncbi:unnamed protein product [Thlaspi arvense]|uniref:Auxin response factor n=1 Tax=Thlaspi arvense TaxID=13288 RepID=A0AAU9RCW3_THLAR|nr:unnamed protein product [Thlaspi arvense]